MVIYLEQEPQILEILKSKNPKVQNPKERSLKEKNPKEKSQRERSLKERKKRKKKKKEEVHEPFEKALRFFNKLSQDPEFFDEVTEGAFEHFDEDEDGKISRDELDEAFEEIKHEGHVPKRFGVTVDSILKKAEEAGYPYPKELGKFDLTMATYDVADSISGRLNEIKDDPIRRHIFNLNASIDGLNHILEDNGKRIRKHMEKVIEEIDVNDDGEIDKEEGLEAIEEIGEEAGVDSEEEDNEGISAEDVVELIGSKYDKDESGTINANELGDFAVDSVTQIRDFLRHLRDALKKISEAQPEPVEPEVEALPEVGNETESTSFLKSRKMKKH
mmetsp:Transcript_27254/g.28327  ORF Transcript_27254/g.28327 Transcript_27254/m.28327 type:complete len:331 (+) Transcript_27254:100-1092(+)